MNSHHAVDEQVRAGRAALLDLLANLLLHELDAPTARALAADPALSDLLSPPESDQALSDLRAEYTRLFLIDVPPYASVYLDAPPVIGGETSVRWVNFLAAQGLPSHSLERAAGPDHAGLYLRALAAAERADHAAPVLREALRWLPQSLTAIQRNEDGDKAGFYGRVAALAAQALQSCADAAPAAPEPFAEEPPPEPEVSEEEEGLREISRWLSTPAWSGWFLSKRALRQLSRRFGVSVGIVDRERMLEQVFEASSLDGRTPELLNALLDEWTHWETSASAWRDALGAWAILLDPWQAALHRSHERLTSMRAALQPS